MSTHRMIPVVALLAVGLAACDRPGPLPEVDTPAESVPAPQVTDSIVTDTVAELPPGLAPVAIDNDAPRRPVTRPPVQPVSTTGDRVTAAPVATQQDSGEAILRRAATAYENVRTMQADFTMQFSNPILRQQTTSRGTLYQQRPDRIALRFTEPDGDVILSDGQHFYIYQPSVDPKQAARSPVTPSGGGGVDLQAQFVGNPVERFTWTMHGTETVAGREANAMTLTPRQRAEYRSLKVWFDTRDSLARRFEITEHNGSVRRFDLTNVRINATIPDGVFRFTPPAGVRIVNVG